MLNWNTNYYPKVSKAASVYLVHWKIYTIFIKSHSDAFSKEFLELFQIYKTFCVDVAILKLTKIGNLGQFSCLMATPLFQGPSFFGNPQVKITRPPLFILFFSATCCQLSVWPSFEVEGIQFMSWSLWWSFNFISPLLPWKQWGLPGLCLPRPLWGLNKNGCLIILQAFSPI